MILTICGVAGSGKSTISKLLAKELGYKHFSAGDMQREVAKDKGLTIEELGRLEAKDDKIDREIDAKMTRLGETQDNFVMDAWLGFHFLPKAIKIFLQCDPEVGAQRIFNAVKNKERDASEREVESIKESIELAKERMEVNRKRWIEYYKADYLDESNYDLIIDTSDLSPDEIVGKILEFAKDFKS